MVRGDGEGGDNAVDIEKAKAAQIETQGLLDKAENAMEALDDGSTHPNVMCFIDGPVTGLIYI